jgi:hypothetical protein
VSCELLALLGFGAGTLFSSLTGLLRERVTREKLASLDRADSTVRIAGVAPRPRGHRHVWAKRSEEATNRQRIGVYVCAGCTDLERRVEGEGAS